MKVETIFKFSDSPSGVMILAILFVISETNWISFGSKITNSAVDLFLNISEFTVNLVGLIVSIIVYIFRWQIHHFVIQIYRILCSIVYFIHNERYSKFYLNLNHNPFQLIISHIIQPSKFVQLLLICIPETTPTRLNHPPDNITKRLWICLP